MRPIACCVAVLGASLLSGCAADHQQGQCVMHEVADLPVLNDRGQPIIKARVDGTPVAFMVDTGAALSMVSSKAVEPLSLRVNYDHQYMMQGAGGSVFAYGVMLHRLDLVSSVAHDVEFAEAGDFGGTVDGLPVIGLFGADFLANYDVEFDLPAHHVGLYREENCAADFPSPWSGTAARLPYDLQKQSEVHLTLSLDGHPIDTQLDSGAAYTILDLDTAHAVGVTTEALARDRSVIVRGIDENPTKTYLHRFGSLTIGPERFAPAMLMVGDIVRSLLGANLLRTHRVWISYPHQIVWLQPAHPAPVTKVAGPPPIKAPAGG